MRIRTPDCVPIDLPDGAPVGAHLRLQVIRQGYLRQSFEHFLAVPIIVRLVVEYEHEAGKTKQRIGPKMLQMRNAVHLNLDRNRDLLFDLFGSAPRPLRNNLHVVVGDIGVGFDRQIMKGESAPPKQKNCPNNDDKAIIQSKIDQSTNHRLLPS